MDWLPALGLQRERKENRLRRVLGIVTVGRDAVTDAVDHARITAHDLLERHFIAAFYELTEKFIRALLREEPLFPQGITLPRKQGRRWVKVRYTASR